jgi:hypothetical protein
MDGKPSARAGSQTTSGCADKRAAKNTRDNRVGEHPMRGLGKAPHGEAAMPGPLHRHGHQRPQDQRVEHQHQRHRGHGSVAQRQLGQRQAQQHIVGKNAAQRERRLRHAIHCIRT